MSAENLFEYSELTHCVKKQANPVVTLRAIRAIKLPEDDREEIYRELSSIGFDLSRFEIDGVFDDFLFSGTFRPKEQGSIKNPDLKKLRRVLEKQFRELGNNVGDVFFVSSTVSGLYNILAPGADERNLTILDEAFQHYFYRKLSWSAFRKIVEIIQSKPPHYADLYCMLFDATGWPAPWTGKKWGES